MPRQRGLPNWTSRPISHFIWSDDKDCLLRDSRLRQSVQLGGGQNLFGILKFTCGQNDKISRDDKFYIKIAILKLPLALTQKW